MLEPTKQMGGKTSKTKTYKEHGPTIERNFWLCSHTDAHKREGKTYSMSTSPNLCPVLSLWIWIMHGKTWKMGCS